MPQQINIITPILLTKKRYLSASTLFQISVLVMLCGGGLYSYLIWKIDAETNELKKTSLLKLRELETIQASIKQNGLKGTALAQLQNQRAELLRIEKIIVTLQQGATRLEYGHAARLELLAQTIPADVWITQLSDKERRLEIIGLTLEPASVETWIRKLVKNPIFKSQTLQAVKVDSVADGLGTTSRPMWSFNFTITLDQSVATIDAKL